MDQKIPRMEPAQLPQATLPPCPADPSWKWSLYLVSEPLYFQLLSTISHPPHHSPPGSSSLVTFPQVLRVVLKHSQSSARMNHFSLTASSHRESALSLWGSCGSTAELTSKLDAVLWMHPNGCKNEWHNHFHQLLAVLLDVQHRMFLTFLLPGLSSPGSWGLFLQGFSLGSVSPAWIALRAGHVCTCAFKMSVYGD